MLYFRQGHYNHNYHDLEMVECTPMAIVPTATIFPFMPLLVQQRQRTVQQRQRTVVGHLCHVKTIHQKEGL